MEDLLAGAGLNQVITYSFGDDKWPDTLRLAEDDARRRMVPVSNPLSLDQAVMRTMLLPGLLETARRNVSVREERVHVFEVGKVFLPTRAQLPDEPLRVGILVSGDGTRIPGCAPARPWTTSWSRDSSSGIAAGLHVSVDFSRPDERTV